MKRFFLTAALAAGFLAPASARAHFIFLVQKADAGKNTVHVYFSEDGTPDHPELLDKLTGLKVQRVTDSGETVAVPLSKTAESLAGELPGSKPSVVVSSFDYGVVARGENNRYMIVYHSKSGPAIDDAAWAKVDTAKLLPLDVVPAVKDDKVEFTVLFQGKPAAKAEVTVIVPGADPAKAETNEQGKVTFEKGGAGMYVARARVILEEKGEADGKPYDSLRHYSTVTFSPSANAGAQQLTALTPAVTSLGGALVGNDLYIYGGNLGSAHSYHNKGQSNQLRKLTLEKGAQWQTVAEGPALQGLALVAHGGKLIRIGGFTAKNDEDQPNELESQASVASFDPATGKWTDLPSLPEPRSSHDAAVLGDTVYVIGGWQLGGKDETTRGWHDTAWALDLSAQKPEWKAIAKPPFTRRALAVAAYDNKLYAIGGMQKEGSPSRQVDIYDPETNAWYQGPEIVGDDGMTGFGASAFATGGKLYVSTIKGNLQRLTADGKQWEVVRDLPTARFFHRMLPTDDSHFVMVGGANMETGKFEQVEVIAVP